MISRLDKYLRNISRILSYAGVVCVLLVALLQTADVLMRAIFNSPIKGTHAIVEFMMIIVVFCGIAYTQYTNTNIKVEILYERVSRRVQIALDMVFSFLSFCIMLIITWQAFILIDYFKSTNKTDDVLYIPFMPFQIILFIGCAILTLVLLLQFIRNLIKERNT